MIVFLHLPKTAGHSLKALALARFGEERVAHVNDGPTMESFVRDHRPGRWDFVQGHMPWGLAERVGERGTYFTVLREPVDRFVSDYYYIHNAPGHPAHRGMRERGITLRDFARVPSPVHPFTQNAQVRRLCRYDLRPRSDGRPWWAAHETIGDAALDDAKETLARRIDAFGLYERMADTMAEFAALIGTELHEMPRENVTPLRRAVNELDDETVAAIREANRFDVALYEFAVALADARAARRSTTRPAFLAGVVASRPGSAG